MKIKKILEIIILIILLMCIMTGNVFALTDCSASLELNKREYNKNDEVIVSVKISNIDSKVGVIAFGATLEYDKNSLDLLGIEGKNNWQVLNSDNGKLVADRNRPTKDSETILEIRFKVKAEKNSNVNILLNNISIADGDLPMKEIPKLSSNIVIKEIATTPENKPNETPSVKPDNKPNVKPDNKLDTNTNNNLDNNISSNNVNNNNKNNTIQDSTISKTELPKTGNNIYIYLIIGIIILIILSTVLYIRYKKIGIGSKK